MSDTAKVLELLEEYTERDPNYPILFDETHKSGITYAMMDEMSGRVYGWLKENGVGKEDFVLINLPRGVLPLIAMIGVWKAGAAWALVEDTYAPERINYIRKDCGCKEEINAGNWDVIMAGEPLSGHEPTDKHDAAYAIYTSGTTGNPKGVLHEYGNLERAVDALLVDGQIPFKEGEVAATLAPLNFVASVIVALAAFSFYKTQNHIPSYNTIKNPTSLAKLFLMKRVSATFLTPSYVRMLGKKSSPFLRILIVGSEPANNIYAQKPQLVNVYACSESGFPVGVFRIDKSYDTCPIGKPQIDTKIILLGEDGQEVKDGETGELCFEDPYVRGYINLPEETEKAFIDGMFHSGDLAKKDENGNYILLGRSNDMIKINGNRIEPAEIEAAVKEALNIDWCAARSFEDGDRSFLCAYYKANITFDQDELRKKLEKRLPYYMIPAYYVKIDEVPMKANGKMDRKALPKPEIKKEPGADYVAPENEVQEKLCNAMAEVLHMERVGIHDDFYEMGGDSLTSIEMLTACDLPGLSTNEIFTGRTPEKIAVLYEKVREENPDGTADERNEEALKEPHYLTAEQRYMVDYQFYTPASTMYNLFSMLKLDKALVNMEDAAKIMKASIAAHPALLTTFFWNEDGELMQKYTPEVLEDIPVEHLSEFEMQFVKDTLVYPFKIIEGKMFRCRVFETESAGYIFFDVHHTLFDGTSMKVFMAGVQNAFLQTPIDPDYYYLMLSQREHAANTAQYEEARKYFEERYDGIEWSSYPRIDHTSRDNEMGELMTELGIENARMQAVEKEYHVTRNEFFISVAALAISMYNNAPDIKLSWIYNGREDLQHMKSVGLLFRDLPIGIRFKDSLTLKQVFEDIHEQVRLGIEHSCYPYVDLNNQVANNESAYLLYQQDIRDTDSLSDLGIEMVDVRQNQAASQTIMDMEILDGEDGPVLMLDYAASRYNDASMERYMNLFIKVAQTLAGEYCNADTTIGAAKAMILPQSLKELAGKAVSFGKDTLRTLSEGLLGIVPKTAPRTKETGDTEEKPAPKIQLPIFGTAIQGARSVSLGLKKKAKSSFDDMIHGKRKI